MDEQTLKSTNINALIACALIEAMGMAAENTQRTQRGESIAYPYDSFAAIIEEYGLLNHDGKINQ